MDTLERLHEADKITEARAEFERGVALINAAAHKLMALDIEPRVGGWTTPGEWGYVRIQGNASANYERLSRG